MEIVGWIVFTLGLAGARAMISPGCIGGLSLCTPIQEISAGSGQLGSSLASALIANGGLASMNGATMPNNGEINLNCRVAGGGGLIAGSFSNENINPCLPQIGLLPGMGGETSAMPSFPVMPQLLLSLPSGNIGMTCSGLTLGDKPTGPGMGSLWPADCYNRVGSIFLNGFITGQKMSDFCCSGPSALYGNKLLR